MILTQSGAAWRDITVAMTEHAPAAKEIRTNTGANTLSVALVPVERALWRIDDGPTLTKGIPPATVSVRASPSIPGSYPRTFAYESKTEEHCVLYGNG